MKKTICGAIITMIILSFVALVQAESEIPTVSKEKLTKEIILSRYQIKKDYSDGVKKNDTIAKYFAKVNTMSSTKRIARLKVLEERFLKIRTEIKEKTWLSDNEKKLKNLVENLFYRTYLELYY